MTTREQSQYEMLLRMVGAGVLTTEAARRGMEKFCLNVRRASREAFTPQGLTIGDLTTSQVHPKRLLAELAEEFDREITT